MICNNNKAPCVLGGGAIIQSRPAKRRLINGYEQLDTSGSLHDGPSCIEWGV